MPIIIWGSRGLTSTLNQGRFWCPQCQAEREYRLAQVRPWFTAYFIPIFPIGGAQRYVECRRCAGTFHEDVLEMGPPTEGQQLEAGIFRDLEGGMSLDEAERGLEKMGMDRERARSAIEELAGTGVWTCQTCQQRYMSQVRQCRRCKG
jgi:hypothetical protein